MEEEIISKIMDYLADTDRSLETALLNAKVFANRINHIELSAWINFELLGYPIDVNLPPYRESFGLIIGTYIQGGRWKFENVGMPIPDKFSKGGKALNLIQFRQGIKSIESFVGKEPVLKFSAETTQAAQFAYDRQNPGIQILSMQCQPSSGFISDILTSVRTKLLDFILGVEKEYGTKIEYSELKKDQKTITYIMNHTINNNGDGNVLNTGENTKINANINVYKNDKDYLSESLKQSDVSDNDVASLLEIIDSETPSSATSFGPKVNAWILKMMGKAADTSWKIGIGAAGGLLSKALASYYGIQ